MSAFRPGDQMASYSCSPAGSSVNNEVHVVEDALRVIVQLERGFIMAKVDVRISILLTAS